tara:strand:- start:349 stop:525 length:177 start_codon:yes stop_codon:yes gene_type:complete
MEIKDAQYHISIIDKSAKNIKATIDGVECFVPMVEDNIHYAEILKQVAEGTLTIKDAE